jgi:hypothetical protein
MADIAEIGKQYNSILKKYSPKDKATSKPTRVPKMDSGLSYLINQALYAYDEYESGNIEDTDGVIQILHNGLLIANDLLKDSYINSHVIEKRERSNADTSYALGAHKGTRDGIEKGIEIQKGKHGSNTSPFKAHEQSILKLFDKYQASQSLLKGKPNLPSVKIEIENTTGLDVGAKAFEKWRANYLASDGTTIFKIT